ncbi:MAG: PDZ domain-containing protein [Gemmatimonadetes bacterium]|nr:PDZ domain-containing protein [Gemmatimonadota bacterium]
MNGERVERVGQLQRVVAQYRPGDIVDVEVVRYGEPHRFRVRLTQAPIPEDPQRRVAARGPERLGLEVAELTPTLARRYGIDRPGGAVVVRVEPLSPAQRKDVQEGERIVAIDRRTVGSASEAQALLRAARPGEVLSLVLRDRGGRTRIANIRVP